MTSISLNTGVRSLLTAQFVLDTIGHNIANANTPGYSRQRVRLGTTLPINVRGLLVGSGVDALVVQRSVDSLLNRRILSQVSTSGRLGSQLGGLTEVESLFGELDGQGLGDLMDSFYSSVSELSTGPEDSLLRTGVAQAGVNLTSQFNRLADSFQDLRRDTTAEIELLVASTNRLADDILALNRQIAETEVAGMPANDLRDQRNLAAETLSGLVDVAVIEDQRGSISILAAGNILVSSSRTYELSVGRTPSGEPAIEIEGSKGKVPITGGKIGGLLDTTTKFVPSLMSELDRLARSLILELNRVHSVGVPASGAFQSLTGANRVQDLDQDGKLRDELLSSSGLPFDVSSGAVYVNIVEEATGAVSKHRIDITATHTTVGNLLDDLTKIPHLSAGIDAFGRVRLIADAGFGFDFSSRLVGLPDPDGTFGGGRASLGTTQGPHALSDGATLDLTAPSGGASFTITFDATDFADITSATADEIAAIINADPGAQAAGLVASAVDGHLFLQTLSEGSAATFTLDGGTALGGLGWSAFAGTTLTGQDNSVDVSISGTYEGDGNDIFTFRPNMDGVIGTTAGLVVDVFDASGFRIASLAVGDTYEPGDPIDVAEGVKVEFGLGEISSTHSDMFVLEVVEDSDTTDALVALGLNSFLTGSDASDISVQEGIVRDPSLIASSSSGAVGDNALLRKLLDTRQAESSDLGDLTFGQFYGDVVGELGFTLNANLSAQEANESLLSNLGLLRDSVSGVNVDEEMVDLLKYEQSFAAASQFITVINGLSDELLSLI